MQELVSDFAPDVVVMDPISDLLHAGGGEEVSAMLTRQVDYLKSRGVTALFTSLNTVRDAENSEQHIGSLIDTWIIAKLAEGDGTRSRVLYVLKSRGMAHSHEIREFVLSGDGSRSADVYRGGAVAGHDRPARGPTTDGQNRSRPRPSGLARDHRGRWHLRLYVAGESPKSLAGLANLKQLCETHLGRSLRDRGRRPARATRGWPAATRSSPFRPLSGGCPHPIRKIIGDLSDTDRVLVGLQLRQAA